MLNNEIWENVPDLPYEVSNFGVVRRKEGKYKYKNRTHIKPYLNNKGYYCVNLYMNSKVYKYLVHRLVGIAFVPNPNNYTVINHIDGNPLNNHVSNLEWYTQSQNIKHAWDTGLFSNRYVNASNKNRGGSSKYVGVSWSKERQRWCAHIRVNKKSIGLGRYKTEEEAAKAYDFYVTNNNLTQVGYSTNFI